MPYSKSCILRINSFLRICVFIVLTVVFPQCTGLNNPYTGEEDIVVIHESGGTDPKGFDHVRSSDVTSSSYISQIYESLYQYSYLERPYKIEPCLAAEMPIISEDKLVYTIPIKKGVYFQDAPCFTTTNGKGRELTADDFVYSFKRLADTKTSPEGFWIFKNKIIGINEFYEASMSEKPTDYSAEIEGLTAIDRYTLQLKLTEPYPQLLWILTMTYTAAVPREAVEYYGEEFINYPVGTGPFILKQWNHWHSIILERNKNYRSDFYPSTGEPSDKEAGLLADAGKKLPLADKVIYSIIKEDQPRWLYFLSGYVDTSGISKDNWDSAMSSLTQLSPEMQAKNVTLWRDRSYAVNYVSFNMNDPILGNRCIPEIRDKINSAKNNLEEAEKNNNQSEITKLKKEITELECDLSSAEKHNYRSKKLRQAMSLAYNRPERIKIFANNRAEPAQGPIPPGFNGYDPEFKNQYSEYNITKAKELLKEAGYADGLDSNGKQLSLIFEMTSASTSAQQNADFFVQEMKAIGIEVKPVVNTWTEFQKKLRDNRAQIYSLTWIADYPDPENFLQLFYGPNVSPNPNNANYRNESYDKLFDEMRLLSDFIPEERERKYNLCREMEKIVTEDCPWIFALNYYSYTLVNCWRKNHKPHPFAYNTMKYQCADMELRNKYVNEWNKPVL
ncbi:MAG: ABC transporter substrate-binding protein, partial [Planctomycetota bacterium]